MSYINKSTNPYLTQTPSPAATPFLGCLCFTSDEIFDVICVCVCVCVFECLWECVHSWGRQNGVLGPPFERGLTVQDWTIFIYNRAEENRFVPDDIFIDWNMYCLPFLLKMTNLRTCGSSFVLRGSRCHVHTTC